MKQHVTDVIHSPNKGSFIPYWILFFFLTAGFFRADGQGCGNIALSLENYQDCCYRLQVDNSSECYPFLRIVLDQGSFTGWGASSSTGWTGQQISPTEILLTHAGGFVPIGASTPIGFCLPPGVSPLVTVLWDFNCGLGESCFFEIPVMGCPDPGNAQITGVKYKECNGLAYNNQPVVPGWVIGLYDVAGNLIAEETTASDGVYAFYDLPAGNYIVRETAQPGWTPNVPASGQSIVSVDPSEHVTQNFGNCAPQCSCDSIFMDVVAFPAVSDTCEYQVIVQNQNISCIDEFTVSLSSGKFAGWSAVATGWSVIELDSQHLQLDPPGNFLAEGQVYPLQFSVTGSAEFVVTLSARGPTAVLALACSIPFTQVCPVVKTPPCCPAGNITGPEQVINGNFSAGFAGFTSGYPSFTPGGFTAIGRHSVLMSTQVYPANNQWSCTDHTTSSATGRMLIVDGSFSSSTIAWQEIVSVVSGVQYSFEAFVNNLVIPQKNYADPVVELWINNQFQATITLPESPNAWRQLCALWTSTVTGLVPIQIRVGSATSIGNDFAVDDISFHSCTTPPCQASFTATPLNNCGLYQITSTSTGAGPLAYQWCDGTTTDHYTVQLPCGPHTFCVTVFCADGTVSTATQTVNVTDNTPPVAVCVPGFGVSLGANCTYTVSAAQVDGGSTDNCQIQSLSVSPAVLTGCGVSTVTLTVTDWCNNTSTCSTGIQTLEVTPPVIVCPPNTTVNTNPGVCYYTGILTPPVVTDNCDPNPTVTCSLLTSTQSILITSATQFPKGVNNITCFAQDNCGNTSPNCNYTLTVVDNQPPVITCPGSVTVVGMLNPQGTCSAVVTGLTPTVTDNCPMVNVTYLVTPSGATGSNDASGLTFSGNSIVTYTATDMGGNTATCSFAVNITCDNCACPGTAPSANVIANGSFTAGNTGFTSGLLAGTCTAGYYGVFNNFNTFCSSWPIIPAHTAPNCLLLDGSTSAGPTVLWQSPVTIVPNMDYCFSFWWACAITSPTQSFPISIDIVDAAGNPVTGPPPVGSETIAQNPLGTWQQSVMNWNSGTLNGNYYIAIRQLSGDDYRDFGIDDICFTKKTPPCTCGTFSNISYRPSQGAPNIPAVCGDTLVANCETPINWTLGGEFMCQGNSCPANTPMYWTLTGPAGSTPQTSSMTASPGFNISLPPWYFNVQGMFQLTLSAICGPDTCHCTFYIDVKCPPCPDCPGNLVKNPGFNNGLVPGELGAGGASANWTAAALTPDVTTGVYCCDPGGIQMWGSQDVGEAICQGITFTPGKTYSVSFSAIFYPDPTLTTPYVQFGFYANTGCVDPFSTNCATCETIGISQQITNTYCTTYTLPAWSPVAGGNTLIIKALNANNYPLISFGRIDNICIIECDSTDLGGGLTGFFPFNGITNAPLSQSVTDATGTANGTGTNITFVQNSTAHFNGSSSKIDATAHTRGVTTAVSVVAWVNTTETLNGQWVAGQYNFSNDRGYSLQIGDNINGNIGKVGFGGRDGTSTYHSSGYGINPPLVNDGQWHCLVGTAGNNLWSIYVDGNRTSATAGSTNPLVLSNNTEPFTIGWHTNNNTPLWFDGDIDDVRIYNRVLTECEIDSVCADGSVSGIKNLTPLAKVYIYPNPTAGEFTVELPEPASSGMFFRITDLTGRIVMEKQTATGAVRQTVQASALPGGLYFLQVIADGEVLAVQRWVKQ